MGWAHVTGAWEKVALALPVLWGGGWHSCESIHQLSYFLPCFCSTCSYLTISCLPQASCISELHDSRPQPNKNSSMNKPDLLEAARVGTVFSCRFSSFFFFFSFRILN